MNAQTKIPPVTNQPNAQQNRLQNMPKIAEVNVSELNSPAQKIEQSDINLAHISRSKFIDAHCKIEAWANQYISDTSSNGLCFKQKIEKIKKQEHKNQNKIVKLLNELTPYFKMRNDIAHALLNTHSMDKDFIIFFQFTTYNNDFLNHYGSICHNEILIKIKRLNELANQLKNLTNA